MRQPVQSSGLDDRAEGLHPLSRLAGLLVVFPSLAVCACGPALQQSSAAPPAAAAAAPAETPRSLHLIIDGTRFLKGQRPFEWRGITAFRLAEMIAHGREHEAVAFLDWARQRELTVVRVFLMADGLFQLTIEDGLRALPRLLELAADRAIHVEAVVLTGTGVVPTDLESAVKRAGDIAVRHPNALIEIANEPWHPTQDKRLHDPAFVKRLADRVPAEVPVALGSAEFDAGYAAGRYATWHAPRSSEDDGWRHVLDLAQGATLAAEWRKPVVSDEPIGAGPKPIPGRRDNAPERFAAAAALSRLAGLHPTFHYDSGLQAQIPTGAELDCFIAWQSGLNLVKGMAEGGVFVPAGDVEALATVKNARAAFGRQFERDLWILAVDADADASVTPAAGWRLEATSSFRRLLVARLQR